MAALLEARIAALGRQRATAVSLRDLFKYGSKPSPSVRLQNALFLQRELPIRMAQRVEELKTLPFGLHQSRPIMQVIDWYSGFVDTLVSMPRLASCEDEQDFTATIETMLQTPDLVVVMLSSALLEVDHAGATPRSQQLSFLQSVFDRFFTARIGLRFLMEHHINSGHPQPEGWSGVIQANFNPVDVIRDAADDASRLCEEELGVAPEVHVRMSAVEDEPSPQRNSRLTYVPSHMHYICTELLKNSMRATATRHRDAPTLPPVTVTAAFGADSLGVRISDEGGGISKADRSNVWRYAYTTAPTPLIELDDSQHSRPPQMLRRSALAGYGMGLPLSRLYAQYLGGRLDLRSLEGHGTDCFLHLARLGAACETLPAMVTLSPAERESTHEGGPGRDYALASLSEYEHAVLSEKLAEIRHRGVA